MPTSPPPARRCLVASYVLLAAAGVAAMMWSSPSVSQAGRVAAIVWAAFLVIGGLMCATGAVRQRWTGEVTGLPLLISVWLVYGLTSGYTAVATGRPSAWAGCFGLLSVAALLGYRWEVIAVYRRAARQSARRRDEQT